MSERMAQGAPADAVDSAVDGLHELAVANPSFFVEKLGAECSDLQGLRELTVNGLQAIAALGDGARSRVVWDIDWQGVEATCGRVRKLSVIDDGVGMTPGQMRYFINHLAASSHEQGRRSNYGVGAKIAAGSRNPHGLEYRSWHHGRGALVRFRRHADGRWGLERRSGPTVALTSGVRSARTTSRGCCGAASTARRSCCSVAPSATTQPARRPRRSRRVDTG
jgi:hypothetical protein